ncbi:metallopeptidase family protein [Pseudactinotalea sp. Z1739]|uniref:metallopeptidase family protein n=1 Tax=Pseudactinotalea sp. Z1739 TaxID=3413028 RepID=UPI003C7CBE29
MSTTPQPAGRDLSTTVLPSRRTGRRRDRRGRGLRGPLLPPTVPGARTGAQRFDALLLRAVAHLEHHLGDVLHGVEFAVEDVPPSAPAPWEAGAVSLGRCFPADAAAGLTDRVVVYRRPIESRCRGWAEVPDLLRHVLVEQVAHLRGLDPDQMDPGL